MNPLLQLERIELSHWRGVRELPVLKGVSLDVHPGEVVGIYGQRGSGKTTLLRLAAGLQPPNAGRVLFDGVDLSTLSRRRRAELHRTQVGWVERGGPLSQDLLMRVYVALPLYRPHGHAEAQRRAMDMLTRLGVPEAGDMRWSSLSDTVRMRVALAHALVREPRLLIVDDPTAGLNIIERERIMGLLRTTAEERRIGVLVAVPDMPAMLHAHEVRSLSRGRLLAPSEPPPDHGAIVQFPAGGRVGSG